MIKFIFCLTFLVVVGFWGSQRLVAQETSENDTTRVYKIELIDGQIFVGKVLKEDSLYVVMSTDALARLEIVRSKIKSMEEVTHRIKNGQLWFGNPHATRYFFGPSAFNLKKGEGYYQNTYIFFNSVNYAVTDYFSVGGGIEFTSTFVSLSEGEFKPIYFVMPKVSFRVTEKFYAGGGILYVHVPSSEYVGICYGMTSYGTPDANVTAGIGWGFVEGSFSKDPIVTISGMKRISRKIALLTENWFIPADGVTSVWSYGLRFLGEKLSVDLGFINNKDIAEILLIGVPYVDFVVKF